MRLTLRCLVTANLFLMLCFGKNERLRRYSRFIHYGYVYKPAYPGSDKASHALIILDSMCVAGVYH